MNVLIILYYMVTFSSCNGRANTSCGLLSAHCTQFFEFTLPVNVKCASFVHRMRKSQLLSSLQRIRNLSAKSSRNCLSTSSKIWTRWNRYGNMFSKERRILRAVEIGRCKTRETPRALAGRTVLICNCVTDELLQQFPKKREVFQTELDRMCN